jgi:gamma-glutamyltranspeptidase/glutathione hydrolase
MGGYMQPQGHFQMLVNMLDLEMSPQQALDVSRWRIDAGSQGVGAQQPGGLVHMEEGWSFDLMAELTRRGHRIAPTGAYGRPGYGRGGFGGGQIIVRDPETGVLIGGSDPRKDGCAIGW